LRRDQVNVVYNLKSAHYVSLGTPTQGGFTDPTVGLRDTGWNLGDTWHLSQDRQAIPTLILGYERAVTAHTNINLQGYATTSLFKHQQADVPDLLKEKYQLTLGVRHRHEKMLYSFGITENLQNLNNTPDIGFQLGVAYITRFAAVP